MGNPTRWVTRALPPVALAAVALALISATGYLPTGSERATDGGRTGAPGTRETAVGAQTGASVPGPVPSAATHDVVEGRRPVLSVVPGTGSPVAESWTALTVPGPLAASVLPLVTVAARASLPVLPAGRTNPLNTPRVDAPAGVAPTTDAGDSRDDDPPVTMPAGRAPLTRGPDTGASTSRPRGPLVTVDDPVERMIGGPDLTPPSDGAPTRDGTVTAEVPTAPDPYTSDPDSGDPGPEPTGASTSSPTSGAVAG